MKSGLTNFYNDQLPLYTEMKVLYLNSIFNFEKTFSSSSSKKLNQVIILASIFADKLVIKL